MLSISSNARKRSYGSGVWTAPRIWVFQLLWFWGVDRAEDMGFSAEFLKEAGLFLDRRNEFPRKATSISLAPEREVPAFVLGPMRRGLAESVETTRSAAAVGD